jgi:sec-independent protein translocase protein TatA
MNLGPTELIVILVIVLIIFGAGRLPQVFSSLGKGVREFRDASEGREDTTTTTTTTTTPTELPVGTPVAPTNTVPTTPVAPTSASTTVSSTTQEQKLQ